MEEKGAVRPMEGEAPMDLVREGATIVKMENETQMAIAVQRPRNEQKILSACMKELELYPSMAKESIYNKPVGKDDNGNMKYAQGLSIRTAESLASRWDNSSFGTAIVSEDEDSAIIAAVFLDYEHNTRHISQQRVSKFYKTKKGTIQRLSPDRFDTVLKANASKCLREAILRSLPTGLKKEYENKARQILRAEPIESQRTAILERFLDLNVSQQILEEWRKKPLAEWTKEDILEALGVVNALREEETSIEEVFGKGQEEKKEEAQQPGLKMKDTEEKKESKDVFCPNVSKKIKDDKCPECRDRKGCPSYADKK